MGISERRERQKIELREAILDAAERIIVQDGFLLLTMRRLADEIEYSAASLYQHFSGRDDIAKALAGRGFLRLSEALSVTAEIDEPSDRLVMLSHTYVTFALAQPVMYGLMFTEGTKVYDLRGSQAFAIFEATVSEMQSLGQIRNSLRPDAAAYLIWSAIHGMTSLKIEHPEFAVMAADELTSMMISTLVLGLATPQ